MNPQTPGRRPTRGRTRGRTREKGQSLVEFALVFPLFWVVIIGLIEFSFLFQALLSVSVASRNAAVVAAEATNASTADCSILRAVDAGITTPANPGSIEKVDIYWTDANGVMKGSPTTYVRIAAASMACTVNGTSFNLKYSRTANGYPYASRCSIRSGCAGHAGIDTIGVKISYHYDYKTPYGAVMSNGLDIERAAEMRAEPFQ